MIELNKTLALVKGGLLDPKQTWQTYLEEEHEWKDTALLLTLPLVVVSVLLSGILTWIFPSFMQSGFFETIMRLIMTFIGIGIAGFIFSYLASFFDGKHNFDKGFAALSLTAIPGLIGSVMGTLPIVGMLLSLGLSILGLVYLYKIIPSYLEVPQGKRVVHFILSLVATIVVVGGLSMILGLGGASENRYNANNSDAPTGMFGEFERQAKLMKKAEQDRFAPTKDARISESQMQALLTTLQKTAQYKKTKEASLEKFGEQLKDKKDLGFGDLMKMASGASSAMSTANAEMDIVKSAGGNWAEHTWVKEQLRIAVMQRDINEAVKYNYALYLKHKDVLSGYGFMP